MSYKNLNEETISKKRIKNTIFYQLIKREKKRRSRKKK
jgi:hypothetical protein